MAEEVVAARWEKGEPPVVVGEEEAPCGNRRQPQAGRRGSLVWNRGSEVGEEEACCGGRGGSLWGPPAAKWKRGQPVMDGRRGSLSVVGEGAA